MIVYDTIKASKELQQILDLQAKNLPNTLSLEEKQQEGFVTIHHDLDILSAMNEPYPHVVARDGDQIVGYTLVMLRSFEQQIPFLVPMFELINQQKYQGKLLSDANYFVMGQVCIAKAYRGKGIFSGLYQKMKACYAPHFDLLITEVSTKNLRSMRAHEKVGFQNIKTYTTKDGESWAILLWDWQ